MVNDLVCPFFVRAVGAAVKRAVRLDAVTENFATAVVAHRREFMNRALETVEHVGDARRDNFKGQIIIVSAHFTFRHRFTAFKFFAVALLTSRPPKALYI